MTKHIFLLWLIVGSISACETEGIDLPDTSPPRHGPAALGDASSPVSDASSPVSLDAGITPDVTPPVHADSGPDTFHPTLMMGSVCSKSSECNSGFCTDGFCCGVSSCSDYCVAKLVSNTCPLYAQCNCGSDGSCHCK